MFFQKPDLTSGSRPVLHEDEALLFVQNGVGLYEGKFKIADCQVGHAYLTSHRACYVDDNNPRQNSLAINLKEVDRHEYQAGFLRSSAKVTLHPRPVKRDLGPSRRPPSNLQSLPFRQIQASSSTPVSRTASPFRPSSIQLAPSPKPAGNWVCTICSFNNPIPSNFDPSTATESFPLPPCLTCGIPPEFSHVLKAAVSASAQPPSNNRAISIEHSVPYSTSGGSSDSTTSTVECSRCTFHNHPSLQTCEICGAPLPRVRALSQTILDGVDRSDSPGPEIATLRIDDNDEIPYVKFSFRAGGDKVFYERLKNALIQRKWLNANAPPPPKPLDNLRTNGLVKTDDNSPPHSPRAKTGVGIAGLEQRGLQSRKNNEAVIGTAFEDLEALMASAKEIIALAEKFAIDSQGATLSEATSADPFLAESATALGVQTTRGTVGDSSSNVFISQIARNLAEYVTDAKRNLLKGQGGVMTLVDFWADYNDSRHGVELISPTDFHRATNMWQTLGLPVRLRTFKSGLLVVQRHDWNDDKVIALLKAWLESLKQSPSPEASEWDWSEFGCGVTAYEAAQRFGWSIGVATEELEMAEERGVLCREEGIQGLRFWVNYIIIDD